MNLTAMNYVLTEICSAGALPHKEVGPIPIILIGQMVAIARLDVHRGRRAVRTRDVPNLGVAVDYSNNLIP